MKIRFYFIIIITLVVSMTIMLFNIEDKIESFNGYTYVINKNNEIYLLSSLNLDEEIIVPSTINGMKVVSIGSNCFNCENTKSITIEGLFEFKKDAFYHCENVSVLTVNNQNNYFAVFKDLNTIEEINLLCDISLANLENNKGLWQTFKSIKYISIDNNYVSISDNYFENMENLEYIHLSDNLIEIGKQSFKNCSSLINIQLTNNVKVLKDECFFGCSRIEVLYLPNSISYIGENCFDNIPLYVYKSSYACSYLTSKEIDFQLNDFEIENDVYNVNIGDIFVINVQKTKNNNSLTFESNNEFVKIDNHGLCFAYNTGQTIISVSDSVITINVIVNISGDSNCYFEDIDIASSFEFDYEKYGLNNNCQIVSSDENIIKVENGKIIPKGIGIAQINVCDESNSIIVKYNVKRFMTNINSINILNILVNENYSITASVTPSNCTNKKLKYFSSNTDIATIDENGKIKGIKAGNCIISILSTDGSFVEKNIYISVSKSKIKTNVNVFPMMNGKSFRIQLLNMNKNSVVYTSLNEDVVSVDQNGKVSALCEGLGFITIDSKDNQYHKTVYARVYGNVVSYGIDISAWNGNLSLSNFQSIKNYGIDFVYIRALICGTIDTKFEQNYTNCVKAKLDVGAYQYSYALTKKDAIYEAEQMVKLLNGRSLQYPVMLDIEEHDQLVLSASTINENVSAYVEVMKKAGYEVIVYSNYALLNKLNNTNYDIHLAQWDTTYTYSIKKEYKIWQITSEGYIANINRHFDLDLCFFDYPSYYEKNHLNHN